MRNNRRRRDGAGWARDSDVGWINIGMSDRSNVAADNTGKDGKRRILIVLMNPSLARNGGLIGAGEPARPRPAVPPIFE